MFANNADRAVDLGESILNQWQHVALVCSGTTGKFFQNGVQVGSDFTIPDTSSYTYFGRSQNTIGAIQYTPRGADDEYNGYMSDLRISSGSRYTGTFTPPTQIFTDDSNTILLTCTNKNNIWDAAAGARILKSSQVDSSTTKRKWTTVDSVYHAGSNDQYGFIMPSTLADDFTIESWFDHDAWNDTQNGFFYFHGGGYYLSGFGSGSSLRLKIWNTGYDYTIQQNAEMDVLRDSGWWHFALCRTGGSSYKAFVNGTQVATFTLSGDTTQRIQVGRGGGSTKEFLGYSQDFRVTNGLARYTTNFTVPSAQFEG